MSRSFKPEVIADSSGKWYDNALRFATHEEAYASAYDLAMRWLAVRDYRAVESPDPVTHRIVDGRQEGVPWRGSDAYAADWPREACPFYNPGHEEDRASWLQQWDLAAQGEERAQARIADRIDGYDRDDLGESLDY